MILTRFLTSLLTILLISLFSVINVGAGGFA